MLDIFNTDAFGLVRLTQSINNLKYIPSRIQKMGIFDQTSTNLITVAIERKGAQLILVPPTPRGSPGVTIDKIKRDMRAVQVPHFEINDGISADEVQGVRAFGSETELETVIGKVSERQMLHVNSFAATEEYARMGAVKGVVTYADGSTLDLFNLFGITPPTAEAFALTTNTANDGHLRAHCAAITRNIINQLDGIPFTGLHAFCGDNFFDALLQHPEVRATYLNWNQAQILRDGYVGPLRDSYGIFEFGGIVWENYRGAVAAHGATALTSFIDTDSCQIFPVGVPGLFRTVYAPADYVETVNTMGQRLYNYQYLREDKKGINFDTQMNALQYCSRPNVLIPGTK